MHFYHVCYYCYRPLHTLAAVLEDPAFVGRALELLTAEGVVPQCINLQNKYKQVGRAVLIM